MHGQRFEVRDDQVVAGNIAEGVALRRVHLDTIDQDAEQAVVRQSREREPGAATLDHRDATGRGDRASHRCLGLDRVGDHGDRADLDTNRQDQGVAERIVGLDHDEAAVHTLDKIRRIDADLELRRSTRHDRSARGGRYGEVRGTKGFVGFGQVQATTGDGEVGQRRDRIHAGHEDLLDLDRSEGRIGAQEVGRGARHVRGRHRGSAQGRVAVPRIGGIDVRAWSAQIDGGTSVGREARKAIRVRGGSHRKHVVGRVARWIVRVGVVVGRGVARRGDEEPRRGEQVVERLGVTSSAPTVAGDGEAHGVGVGERIDRIGDASASARAEELQAGQTSLPGHTRDTDAVVASSGDGPGAVGPVSVVVHGIGIVVDEVPTVDVVDEPVAVVVEAVAGNLAGVGPHVVDQVGVEVIQSRVDDAHLDVLVARVGVPSQRRLDLVHPVQERVAGIVGDADRFHQEVGFGVFDRGILAQQAHRLVTGHPGFVEVHQDQTPGGEGRLDGAGFPGRGQGLDLEHRHAREGRFRERSDAGLQADDQSTRDGGLGEIGGRQDARMVDHGGPCPGLERWRSDRAHGAETPHQIAASAVAQDRDRVDGRTLRTHAEDQGIGCDRSRRSQETDPAQGDFDAAPGSIGVRIGGQDGDGGRRTRAGGQELDAHGPPRSRGHRDRKGLEQLEVRHPDLEGGQRGGFGAAVDQLQSRRGTPAHERRGEDQVRGLDGEALATRHGQLDRHQDRRTGLAAELRAEAAGVGPGTGGSRVERDHGFGLASGGDDSRCHGNRHPRGTGEHLHGHAILQVGRVVGDLQTGRARPVLDADRGARGPGDVLVVEADQPIAMEMDLERVEGGRAGVEGDPVPFHDQSVVEDFGVDVTRGGGIQIVPEGRDQGQGRTRRRQRDVRVGRAGSSEGDEPVGRHVDGGRVGSVETEGEAHRLGTVVAGRDRREQVGWSGDGVPQVGGTVGVVVVDPTVAEGVGSPPEGRRGLALQTEAALGHREMVLQGVDRSGQGLGRAVFPQGPGRVRDAAIDETQRLHGGGAVTQRLGQRGRNDLDGRGRRDGSGDFGGGDRTCLRGGEHLDPVGERAKGGRSPLHRQLDARSRGEARDTAEDRGSRLAVAQRRDEESGRSFVGQDQAHALQLSDGHEPGVEGGWPEHRLGARFQDADGGPCLPDGLRVQSQDLRGQDPSLASLGVAVVGRVQVGVGVHRDPTRHLDPQSREGIGSAVVGTHPAFGQQVERMVHDTAVGVHTTVVVRSGVPVGPAVVGRLAEAPRVAQVAQGLSRKPGILAHEPVGPSFGAGGIGGPAVLLYVEFHQGAEDVGVGFVQGAGLVDVDEIGSRLGDGVTEFVGHDVEGGQGTGRDPVAVADVDGVSIPVGVDVVRPFVDVGWDEPAQVVPGVPLEDLAGVVLDQLHVVPEADGRAIGGAPVRGGTLLPITDLLVVDAPTIGLRMQEVRPVGVLPARERDGLTALPDQEVARDRRGGSRGIRSGMQLQAPLVDNRARGRIEVEELAGVAFGVGDADFPGQEVVEQDEPGLLHQLAPMPVGE